MPALQTIITKEPQMIWIKTPDLAHIESLFTPEEIAEVVLPYRDYVRSLPGFISDTVTEMNETTMKIVIEFDTLENVNNARRLFTPPFAPGSIQEKNFLLLQAKKAEHNVKYIYDTTIIE